jgi:hypothetical protein
MKVHRLEFAGLPGAGKTSLCRAILQEIPSAARVWNYEKALDHCLRKRNRGGLPGKLVKMLPALFWKPLIGIDCSINELHRFASLHPSLFHLVFEHLAHCDIPEHWRSCLLYVFIRLAIEHELFCQHLSPGERLFIEEGFIQASLSAFGYLPLSYALPDQEFIRYLEGCPLPDAVIWVHTPAQTCLERLLKRPEMPLVLAQGDRLQRLIFLQTCMERTMHHLALRGVTIWTVTEDGTSPQQQARAWIKANTYIRD